MPQTLPQPSEGGAPYRPRCALCAEPLTDAVVVVPIATRVFAFFPPTVQRETWCRDCADASHAARPRPGHAA